MFLPNSCVYFYRIFPDFKKNGKSEVLTMVPFGRNWIQFPGGYEVSLAIAGGGCKAFYGLGFGYEVRKWGVQFKNLSGVSAGAAMILGLVSESEEKGLDYISSLMQRNSSNFQLSRMFKGQSPFPHENMYRRSIRYSIDMEKIRNTPINIYIQAIAAIPKLDKFKDMINKTKIIPQTASAFIMDEVDKLKGIPCERVEKIKDKWNFREIIYTNHDLKNSQVVEQIILNSSSIPPVISLQNEGNTYFFDGGLVNNLPLELFPRKEKKIGIYYEDSTIFGKDPEVLKNSLLFKPSRELKVTSFDYTNPSGIIDAFELGKADAIHQKETILEFTKVKFFDYLVA